ncbi:MAG: ISL3 family transposase [Planctomycetes bacterium]|nr:ISL3 family transposase [Planctomycetota bacterium]
MRDRNPISELLAIPGYRALEVEKPWIEVLWIRLESLSSRPACPGCRKRCPIYDRVERRIRDIPHGTWSVELIVPVPRVNCPSCGVLQVRLAWVGPRGRRTRRFEAWIYLLTEGLPTNTAGDLADLAWGTVHDIEARYSASRLRGRFRGPYPLLGVDEVSYAKGHQYVTIVTDLRRRRVIWVGKDRRKESLAKFFRWLGPLSRKIRYFVTDMHEPFIQAIRESTRATIVFDRFHIMKLLSGAIDAIRRRVQSALPPDQRKVVKNSRYLLLANRDKLTKKREVRLAELLAANTDITAAYLLKEDFRELYQAETLEEARRLFREWMDRVRESRIPELARFVKTLKNHWRGVMAYFSSRRLSNGLAECFNNIIRTIQKRGYGYRNMRNLVLKIYRVVGEIPSEIEALVIRRAPY